jgi:hypothetical protein
MTRAGRGGAGNTVAALIIENTRGDFTMTARSFTYATPKFRVPERASFTPAQHRRMRELIDEWCVANHRQKREIENQIGRFLLAYWKES